MKQQRSPSSAIPIDLAGTAVTRSISDSADSLFTTYNGLVAVGVPDTTIITRIKRDNTLISSPAEYQAKFHKRLLANSDRAKISRELLEYKGQNITMTERQKDIIKYYNVIAGDASATDEDVESIIDQEIQFLDYYNSMLLFHRNFKNSVPTTYALLTNTLGTILSNQTTKNTDISYIAGLEAHQPVQAVPAPSVLAPHGSDQPDNNQIQGTTWS